MLKRKLLGTAAIVAVFAVTPALTRTTTQIPTFIQVAAAADLQKQDADFAKDAAIGGLAEVQLGQLATQKAADADVKAFGQRMVDDHGKANEQLKSVAQAKGIELPTDLDKKHKAVFDKLSGLDGAAFDQAYVQEMVKDHQKDVKKFQDEADKGQDPDIKAFAQQTLPTLQDHLNHIQGISTKVAQAGGNGAAPAAGAAATDQTQAAAAGQGQLRVIGDMTAEDLIGQDVVNADGKDVGEIQDLVLDQNKVGYVVVNVGGFLGMGDKDVAIPASKLQLNGDNQAILLSGMTEDDLKNLPEFDRNVYAQYPRDQRLVDANAPAGGQPTVAQQQQAAADQNAAGTENVNLQVIGDMTAEQLIGQSLVNSDGRSIGDIDDLVLDHNRLSHVVVGVGGFLGMGEKEVAIPVERLQIGEDQTTIMSAVTEDELKQLPNFEPRLSYSKYPRANQRNNLTAANQPAAGDTAASNTMVANDTAAADNAAANGQVRVIGQMTAEDLIGKTVVNADGRDVGSIDDLVLDNNKVAHVVVGVGGFLGIGEKNVAIPVEKLQLGQDQAIMLSGLTEDDLRGMPEFDRNAYAAYPRGTAADTQTAANATAADQNANGQITAAGRANPLGQLSADDLIGKDVVNAQGDKIGSVDDIVIDAKNDQAVYAVISAGGFLGIGDKKVIVPFDQLAAGQDQAVLQTTATVDQLKSYPQWQEGGAWTPIPRGKRIFQ